MLIFYCLIEKISITLCLTIIYFLSFYYVLIMELLTSSLCLSLSMVLGGRIIAQFLLLCLGVLFSLLFSFFGDLFIFDFFKFSVRKGFIIGRFVERTFAYNCSRSAWNKISLFNNSFAKISSVLFYQLKVHRSLVALSTIFLTS